MIKKYINEKIEKNPANWAHELIQGFDGMFADEEKNKKNFTYFLQLDETILSDSKEKMIFYIFHIIHSFYKDDDLRFENSFQHLEQIDDLPLKPIFIAIKTFIALRYMGYCINDRANKLFSELKDFYEQNNLKEKLAFTLNDMSSCQANMGNFKDALQLSKKAIGLCRENKFDKLEYMLNSLASIYYRISNYDLAFKYYTEALQICKKKPDHIIIPGLYNNIAALYTEMKNYEKALEFYETALTLHLKNKDNISIAMVYNNIGRIFVRTKNYKKAEEYIKKSLDLCTDNSTKKIELHNFSELGEMYRFLNETDKSFQFFDKAEEICHQINDNMQHANILLQKGALYLQEKDIDQAISFFQKTDEISKKFNYISIQKDAVKELALIYAEQKKYDKAIDSFSRLIKISDADETENKEYKKRLAEMQISYEIEIKEREAEIYKLKSIDLANKNKTILRQKNKLEKTLRKLKETEIRYDNIKSQLIDKIDSNIIGESKEIKSVLKLIHRVAKTDNTSILITGESGTGKELVARAIHNFSQRNKNNFCAVNVAAVPETLFESEFYGYVKNAFTGARSNKAGWFQTANRGTLFLDEIGTMNASIQSKLLRVLEDKKFTPVGSTKMQSTDVRIIAATNENLENQIDTSEFRNDLYHRLSPFVIHLPPLRDRIEDIPLLIQYFVKKMSNNLGIKILNVEHQVYSALMSYSFPGNIRELKNMIERALILTDSSTLKLKDFNIPRKIRLEDEIVPLSENEKNMVVKALKKTGFHQTNAAKLLGITAKSLERRMIKYNIKKSKN